MLRPFRGEKETAETEQPPVPPSVPYPAASGAANAGGGRPFVPPAAPLPNFGGSATPPPPASPPEPKATPFGGAAAGRTAFTAAPTHPLEDAFADIRDDAAPAGSAAADSDPDFGTPIRIVDPGAPRPLDPDAVSSSEAFAPVRLSPPPATPSVRQSPAARQAELQRKLAERSGLGGFQGFCPVALRDRRELVDSRPQFLSVYQNRTYELSSAEAKARFEADPTRYAPVNGGRDVVLTARGEAESEGNLAHAVWFKDRLYLFRNAETLREFNGEPMKFAVSE